jgi:hypothetical protein
MRLQTRHDAHREVALAGQRANGGRDGAGSDAGDLAEQAAAIQTVGAQPFGDGEHDLPVRHRRERRRVEPLRPDGEPLGVTTWAEVATLAANASRYSCAQSSHRMRANPRSSTPQARNVS